MTVTVTMTSIITQDRDLAVLLSAMCLFFSASRLFDSPLLRFSVLQYAPAWARLMVTGLLQQCCGLGL